jgi:hypothetical protein
MILPEGRLIPVAPGERDVPDTRVDIIVCANGDWTPLPKPEADGKQKSRRSLRMMTAEEKAKWGTNNECDCKICIKEKQFVANVAEAGRTRSWKVFKKPEGYVLGGGEV